MKAYIHELGVLDKTGKTHPVRFKQGLNVVTGKSSTGKSALIEIFDYCFGSGEYTVPKGVITDSAALYYVYLNVNGQDVVLGRLPDGDKKAFFRREENYYPEKINRDYFLDSHFMTLSDFKKHVRALFLDIDDVDDSLAARENRRFNAKAPTPSIRSFTSFMLQHQNLVANKHALFYRFDEKEKREQVIEHTKIFLGLVDQKFFHLSQEKERLATEVNRIKREQESNKRLAENQKQKIEPVLRQLYAAMGFSEDPISLQDILRHPQDSKERLEKILRPEKIVPLSDAITQLYLRLKEDLADKTSELRRLQRQAGSIKHHIAEEEKFVASGVIHQLGETVHIAKSVCPFCHTEHEQLLRSAEQLQQAISKLSSNLKQAKPMRAKFESSLVDVQRQTEGLSKEVTNISSQIIEIERSEKVLSEKKNLYESILLYKAKLDMLLDSLNLANDAEVEERMKAAKDALRKLDQQLKEYDYKDGLNKANDVVNAIMNKIGQHFEFEDSYKPINLHFSFETFDLYHLTPKDEKIFLRSMGSGANWLYSHVALFLALHKYFASLGEQCAIPSILFLDQPTQVYFPSFKFDKSDTFNKESIKEMEQRAEGERQIDDDMKAVENLFSQLSIYCTETEKEDGFSPQIIVTDHADDLKLSDETEFETLVNSNRWRSRGLINPIPNE
ncbi:DUF3732 domain-containing protein [Nitrosomonas ureae]|uniref:AAA domain-containing protein n=1 Tax=Nitrosomonas ureae TaxID=44577 RepID=A0A1H5RWZ7_9PROT|nr:DUF3732 domain-containing protein [Nitrosomonas ureae]SEF42862.1 AAA domain-containing protein [Nitrosomonas ureae]